MRTIQLYGTGSATANAVASVIIPSATTIKAVQVAVRYDSITDNAAVGLELSKVPTSLIATNGALDPFLHVDFFGNFVTSGLAVGATNLFIPVAVECRQGEVVYLHALVAGTVTYFATFILSY